MSTDKRENFIFSIVYTKVKKKSYSCVCISDNEFCIQLFYTVFRVFANSLFC